MVSRILRILIVMLLGIFFLTRSTLESSDQIERARAFTRSIEFDYAAWMVDALALKVAHASLGTSRYLETEQQSSLALAYLELVAEIAQTEARLNEIYTDPNVADPETASSEVRQHLEALQSQRRQLAPVAESIIQSQVAFVAAEMDLTLGGQPLPPVLYHSTPLPLALIISPRDMIRQEVDISLEPDLTVDQRAALEELVDERLNVSSLVVPVGGVGVYPTMVMQTTNLNWLAEVVAHEWVHNFLTLRPLGVNYLTSPELRTMNETAASIAGKEIGSEVIRRFYPEFAPPPVEERNEPAPISPPSEPPAFDFRAEMNETRITVDALLTEGKIEEAEAYMEARRRFFFEQGYRIRKLNQAYFAFYSAYADEPGGAAGEDPVGSAVRALREQSRSLAQFLNRISWMSSFEDLQQAMADEA